MENNSPGMMFWIIWLALFAAVLAGMWKMFEKAGKPGWACLVPIYNFVVMLDIAGKPWWWLLLCFIPLVNIYVVIMVPVALAKNFGKGTGFALGLIFLGFIFYPMLGFGDAQYNKVA